MITSVSSNSPVVSDFRQRESVADADDQLSVTGYSRVILWEVVHKYEQYNLVVVLRIELVTCVGIRSVW